MERIAIFGAGTLGRRTKRELEETCLVACFADNNQALWGMEIEGVPVVRPADLTGLAFDRVVVCVWADESFDNGVARQLREIGVPPGKIDDSFARYHARSRRLWLRNFAELVRENGVEGSVAEAGVYRGDFARHLNRHFPDRRLYLFDTFSGFDARDAEWEERPSRLDADFSAASVERALAGMPHPERCTVRQGYFPETAAGLDDRFCFVNLDMDLYKPTLEGLRLFHPLLNPGGVILVHDYYNPTFPNVKTAVMEFASGHGLLDRLFPIGDDLSMAIMK